MPGAYSSKAADGCPCSVICTLVQKDEMRKRLKDKARSCALCKPHKKKWANRWKPKELDLIARSEKEIKSQEG